MESKLKKVIVLLIIFCSFFAIYSISIAEGNPESFEQVQSKNNLNGLNSLVDSIQPDYDAASKTTNKVSPYVSKIMGVGIAGIIILLQLLILLDIIYLVFPFTRRFLGPNPAAQQQQSSMPMMGGFSGMGMSSWNGGRFSGIGQESGGVSLAGMQWVSDDAVNALMKANMGNQQSSMPMMGGFPGMGQPQSQNNGSKTPIRLYAVSKPVTLVITIIVLVLLGSGVLIKVSTGLSGILIQLFIHLKDWLSTVGI